MMDPPEVSAEEWWGKMSEMRAEMLALVKREAKPREEYLFKAYLIFRDQWSPAVQDQVEFNRGLSITAVQEYYREIYLKKFEHGITYADCHKRAACIAKCLLKFRPIQLKQEHFSNELASANEEFAVFIACGFLEISFKEVPESILEHMLYCFRKHTFDADSWASAFCLLEVCGKLGYFEEIEKFLKERRSSIGD